MSGNMLELHNTLQLLRVTLYGVWRKRWYGLATAWVICAIAWLLVLSVPYGYMSSARISINESELAPVAVRRVSGRQDTKITIASLRERLLVRSRLDRVIARTDYLDQLASSETEKNRIISELSKRVRILPVGQNIFQVQYTNSDARLSDSQRAQVARDVVSMLVSEIQEVGPDTKANRKKIDFLENEILKLNEKLDELDQLESNFLATNSEFTASPETFAARVDVAERELKNTENELKEKTAERDSLVKQLKNVPATISAAAGSGRLEKKDPLQERIDTLAKDLDALKLQGFKEAFPDVKRLRSQIAELETQLAAKKKKAEEQRKKDEAAGLVVMGANEEPNPLFERLSNTRIEAEQQLTALQTRYDIQNQELRELTAKEIKAPQIFNEYKRLMDEKTSVERNRARLVQERRNVELVASADRVSESGFQMIDPPRVPAAPAGTPRILYMTIALLGAIAAGGVVSLVISVIRPTMISVEQLRHSFDLPVLGNVTRILTESNQKARAMDMLAFGGLGAMLMMVYVVLAISDLF